MRPNSHGDISVTCANLYGRDEKVLLEPLVYARVTRINMGVQLVGFELQGRGGAKSRVERYQQSWLCAAKVDELKALVELIKDPGDPEGGAVFARQLRPLQSLRYLGTNRTSIPLSTWRPT